MLSLGSGLREYKVVYNGLGHEGTYSGADTVGHDHEQALGAGAELLAGLLIHIEASGDVEEVWLSQMPRHRRYMKE